MWTKISSSFPLYVLFVYSINRYLLGTYYMPGTVQGIENTISNWDGQNHWPCGTQTLYWGRLTKIYIKKFHLVTNTVRETEVG